MILLFETSDLMTAKLFRQWICIPEQLYHETYHQKIISEPREVLKNFQTVELKAFLSFQLAELNKPKKLGQSDLKL